MVFVTLFIDLKWQIICYLSLSDSQHLTVHYQKFLNVTDFILKEIPRINSFSAAMDYSLLMPVLYENKKKPHDCNICFIIKVLNLTFWNLSLLFLKNICKFFPIILILDWYSKVKCLSMSTVVNMKDGKRQQDRMGELFSQLYLAIFSART